MRLNRLNDKVKIVHAIVPTAGSVASFTATEVNCTGYNRAMYVLQTGAAGAGNSTMSFKVQEAAATGMAGAADITSAASAGLTKAANASKIQVYDIPVNPAKPFQIAVGAVGTDTLANAAICILYNRNTSAGSGKYPIDTAYATEIVIV